MLLLKGIKYHLVTESEVIFTGKSLTQALIYWLSDSNDWYPEVY